MRKSAYRRLFHALFEVVGENGRERRVTEMKTDKKINIIRNVIFSLLVVGCCVGVTAYAITFYNGRNSHNAGDTEATGTNDMSDDTADAANGTADAANGTADAAGGTADTAESMTSAHDTEALTGTENDSASELPQADGNSGTFVTDSETDGTLSTDGANGNVSGYNFSDVLFIGDSRTVGLSEYGGTDAVFFADVGMSVFNLFQRKVYVPHAGKITLEDLLDRYEYSKIYIMLGINELGYNYDSIISKYTNIVETVKTMQGNAQLILEGNLHVTAERSTGDEVYNNSNIDRLNEGIKGIAERTSSGYIDVNELFDDSQGCLDKKFTSDNTHLLGRYYRDWARWIGEATGNL